MYHVAYRRNRQRRLDHCASVGKPSLETNDRIPGYVRSHDNRVTCVFLHFLLVTISTIRENRSQRMHFLSPGAIRHPSLMIRFIRSTRSTGFFLLFLLLFSSLLDCCFSSTAKRPFCCRRVGTGGLVTGHGARIKWKTAGLISAGGGKNFIEFPAAAVAAETRPSGRRLPRRATDAIVLKPNTFYYATPLAVRNAGKIININAHKYIAHLKRMRARARPQTIKRCRIKEFY